MVYSGEPGDTVQFSEYVERNIKLYSMRTGIQLSPKAVASFTRRELADSLRSRKPYHINVLIAGTQKSGVPEIYWIDYIANMVPLKFAAHGHASYFCMSLLDRYWQPGMDVAQVKQVMRKCLAALKTRYIANLPTFNINLVTKEGIKEIEL